MNQVIKGDCLDVMKTLEDNCIDLILTDPPYSLPNNQFRPEARVAQRTWGEFSPYTTFFKQFIVESKRVLKDTGHIIIFCDETFYSVLYPTLYQNFYASKMLIWDKERIGMGGIWRRQFEIIIDSYSLPQKEKSGDGDILKCKPIRDKLHTSQKPTDLLETLIKKTTKEGDIVLDCFAGSGSTGVACKNLNRDFILIEIEQEYIDIINKRLSSLDRPLPEKE